MTINIEREISRAVPNDIPVRLSVGSMPMFTAYGCALLERDTGKGFVYTAVNLTSGKREIVNRRANPLTTSGVEDMAERIRRSSVAGAGKFEADRPFGEQITNKSCHEMLTTTFNEILPRYGYAVRAEQITLAERVLDTISRRSTLLAESEVGTGKTIAYLIAAAIAKRGRLNGYWNMSFCNGSPYIEMAHMPIVIATSSIALQKSLAHDTIPEISDILLEHGIIKTPLTAVIRKGREHYVCQRNLWAHIQFEHDESMERILAEMLSPNAIIDLAEIDGLTAHVKRKISVPSRCRIDCPHLDDCPYLFFREKAQSAEIDFQICNHNYLLADTIHRTKEQRRLIPNYQMLIIDEFHKFFDTARSMHSLEFSSLTLSAIRDRVRVLNLRHETTEKLAYEAARKLSHESNRLFVELSETVLNDEDNEQAGRFAVKVGKDTARHLRNICEIASRLNKLLTSEPVAETGGENKAHIIWDLIQVCEQATALAHYNTYVYCLKMGDNENHLCAVPKNIDSRLYDNLWSMGVPAVLTSGTLSTSGAGTSCANFSRIKGKLGLERIVNRLSEISLPSPFDYYNNSLIYISENIPFPDPRNKAYIDAITNEIEQLIIVSHGHAAVLFTSYNTMGLVYTTLKDRGIPFPLFRLDKGGVREIERFKQSGNGVLFASGAMWEGIDIPGDALSLLIIVKLPFAVPNFISQYERTQYASANDYKECVLKPDCQMKTKQAFGRVFRTERDTGAVAFMDCRIAQSGAYREYILSALPHCRVTDDILVLEDFFRAVKSPEYFE